MKQLYNIKLINHIRFKFVFMILTVVTLMLSTQLSAADVVRFGFSYIPNVQFSPVYVAQKKGFYRDVGIEVKTEYGYENDFVALTAQGKRECAAASGDQVIVARSQGLPIKYVLEWYHRYPIAVVSKASKNIRQVSDLAGKSVGLPGFYGSNFIGWKALAYATQLNESSVTLKQIGYTQASAIQQDLVDAAVVYIVNEPVQLQEIGIDLNVIEVSDHIDLVSNGLVVGDSLIKKNPDLVRRMVAATLKGILYTIDNPVEAFQISREFIPEMTDQMAPVQKKVLEASIALWRSDDPGKTKRQQWVESVRFMKETGILKKNVDVDDLFTNEFVEN